MSKVKHRKALDKRKAARLVVLKRVTCDDWSVATHQIGISQLCDHGRIRPVCLEYPLDKGDQWLK